jgi:hypothetical protein
VDWDNPAWPDVRAGAIQAAIAKGHDYAAALGGSLRTVEQIADAGLLGGDHPEHRFSGGRTVYAVAAGGDPMRRRLIRFPRSRWPSSKPASPPAVCP